jgi:hypothetical protein
MPPIVAPGVCRFTLHGTVNARPWAAVFDMDIDSDILGDRNINIRDQAQVFLNEWIDHIRQGCSVSTQLTSVSWVDLDSLDGTTGERADATAPRVMPGVGVISGDAAPGNAAVLAIKTTDGGRGTRGGRTYWAGVAESHTTLNALTSAALTTWNSTTEDFLAGVNQDHDGAFDYDSRMQVLHAPGGVFESMAEVTDYSPVSLLATQRRRLRS